MGFHICSFCFPNGASGPPAIEIDAQPFGSSSSADVVLTFESGNSWVFPHVGLLHYVTVHNYQPPVEFVEDVVNSKLLSGDFQQTKAPPVKVGYLTEPDFPTGKMMAHFALRLLGLINQVKGEQGAYRQTRSGLR